MERAELLSERVKGIIGADSIFYDSHTLARYSVSGKRPVSVIAPPDIARCAELLEVAEECRGRLIIGGSGTKLNTGLPPEDKYVALSTRGLKRIIDHDVPNFTVTVQSGATINTVQETLAKEGQFLPLDPPYNDATIGGSVCSAGNGPLRMLYGGLRDLVLGAGLILPGGRRGEFGGRVVKNVAGYDISKLIIGSVGTLGLLDEVTFKLFPLPERQSTCAALFKDPAHALAAADDLRASRLNAARILLLDREAAVLAAMDNLIPQLEGHYTLLTSYHGFDEAVGRQLRDTAKILTEHRCLEIVSFEIDEELRKGLRRINQRAAEGSALILKLVLPSSGLTKSYTALSSQKGNASEVATMVDAGCGVIYRYYMFNGGDDGLLLEKGEAEKLASTIEENRGHLSIMNAPSRMEIPLRGDERRRNAMKIMELIRRKFDPHDVLYPERFNWLTNS